MTGDEHLDLDTLADYAEGLLGDPGQAAGVDAHLVACALCRARRNRLTDVSRILSEQRPPSVPEPVVARIDRALAQERPERAVVSLDHRRRQRGRAWLAGVAASVALVLVGSLWGIQAWVGGGMSSTVDTASGGSGAAREAASSVEPSRAAASTTVSGRHYSSARLPDQVSDLLREEGNDDSGVRVQAVQPTPQRLRPLASPARLASCVSRVAEKGKASDLLAIDLARYSGKPSAVIVTSGSRAREAEVWVVDPTCSVRTHTEVNRPGG